MRSLPRSLPPEGLLVGWSLEPYRRKPQIGFTAPTQDYQSPAHTLEPILDSSEGHLLTVAPTGAGKGVGCIVPALLRYPGPVVVVDPKGENYAVTAERRRQMGQEVILLDPFDVAPGEGHRFNPLDLADPRSEHFIEDVSTLANLASTNRGVGSMGRDPFWPQMGRTLVTAAILDVLTMPDSTEATLPAVRRLLNKPLDELTQRSKSWLSADNSELQQQAGLLSNPAPETLGGYWALAMNQLDFLKGAQIEKHLGGSDLDLNKIYHGEPISIYLVLPPDKLESHAPLLRLWIGTLVSVLARRSQQPKQSTLMLVDEAAQLGELPQLRSAVTLLRGYGVRVWSFWQDLSQLRRLYPYDWETILNNCRIQQFFGATTGMAAEAVAGASGYGPREAVLGLGPDELILNVSGDEPVIARRPNYLSDPPFQGLYDINPFYTETAPPGEPRTRAVFQRSQAPALQHYEQNARQALTLAMKIFNPVDEKHWETMEGEEREQCLALAGLREDVHRDTAFRVRRCKLPFYDHYDWYDIQNTRPSPTLHAYYLIGHGEAHHLDGKSDRIHDLNDIAPLKLRRVGIQRYLKFFTSSIVTERGRFLVLDNADEIEWREKPEASFLEYLREQISAPRFLSLEKHKDIAQNEWLLGAELVHGDSIFTSVFRVSPTGEVEMISDDLVASELPIIPDLERLHYIGAFNEDGEFRPCLTRGD